MTDTTETSDRDRGSNAHRALRPDRHRAALAGALGGARAVRDGPARRVAAQVLPADDVPVPVGRPAHRPLVHRHPERRAGPLPPDARLQRVLPDRLRRLRAAGRERRDQERRPPVQLDDAEHREHAPPVPDDGRDVRLERTRSSPPTRRTTAGTSGCSCASSRPAWPIARCRRSTGAPTTGRSPASRSRAPTATAGAAARWSRSATSSSGSCARRVRRRAARLHRPRLARAGPDHADQLDRPVRGRRDRLRGRARRPPDRRRPPARLHDPARTRCSGRRSWSSRPSIRWSRG